jgi:hypothetical protein
MGRKRKDNSEAISGRARAARAVEQHDSNEGSQAMSTTGQSDPEVNPTQGAVASSLEQVREILVGAQHREFARRLARTDAHVSLQAEELRADARRRLEVLEAHLRSESDAVSARFESQRAAQAEALQSLGREVRDALGLLERRVQRLEEAMARSQREFRQQILDQAKGFLEEVGRTREELGAAFERDVASYGGALEAGEPAEAPEKAGRHDQREAA